MKDEYYEKYGLIKTPIDFEFHLDEDDVQDATRIDEKVRIIEIKGCNVDFGFENDIDDKKMVIVNFGFGYVKVDRNSFEESLKHYHLRDIGLDELKGK